MSSDCEATGLHLDSAVSPKAEGNAEVDGNLVPLLLHMPNTIHNCLYCNYFE